MIDIEVLRLRVLEAGATNNALDADRVIRATLAALAEGLPRATRHMFANELPKEFRDVMLVHRDRRALSDQDLFAIVRRRITLPIGALRERTQVVCQALGWMMRDELRARVLEGLSDSARALFLPREATDPPSHRARQSRHLADGHPATVHPISEARLLSGQSHSIAMESNPHEETKLSSSVGLTQERVDDELATVHPDQQRSIGNAR